MHNVKSDVHWQKEERLNDSGAGEVLGGGEVGFAVDEINGDAIAPGMDPESNAAFPRHPLLAQCAVEGFCH